jgi:hypothetical protein
MGQRITKLLTRRTEAMHNYVKKTGRIGDIDRWLRVNIQA